MKCVYIVSAVVAKSSDVTARPESRRPAQAKPCEAKLYEAPAGLPLAHGSGFIFLKPQAAAQAAAWVAEYIDFSKR
jgi:hypothetical protein